jgi:transposase
VFFRVKSNSSGSSSIQVLTKQGRKNVLVKTIGSSKDPARIEQLKLDAQAYIAERVGQSALDLPEDRPDWFGAIFERIDAVKLIGPELLLGKIFDDIGFGQLPDPLFRHLVLTRIVYPGSKLKTIRYLEEYQGKTHSIYQVYRYLDKLHSKQKERVERISFEHTLQVLGGTMSAVFYDVTTLYFEAEQEDDLRKAGFSKDGKNNHPQILLGLLVGPGGYPLAYDIFEGNSFEGHTMLGVLQRFQAKYDLEKLVVVADAGLLSQQNIKELVKAGHQYILGARLRAAKAEVKHAVLALGLTNGQSKVILLEDRTRLVVSRSLARAKKDAHNRERALSKLQTAISKGKLTKAQINNRGYNRFLKMTGEVVISIDQDKFLQDQQWDGLKGYVTNTTLPPEELIASYKELWRIEKAFRISKTDLRIRPIYHRKQRRIEAHLCICFVAYKIYKELERLLKATHSELSVDRAIECLRTIYGITIKHPANGRTKTKLFTNHKDQVQLLELFDLHLG